jgi:hypothetical protein
MEGKSTTWTAYKRQQGAHGGLKHMAERAVGTRVPPAREEWGRECCNQLVSSALALAGGGARYDQQVGGEH